MTAALPVTGAWRPGDPQGNRQFFTFPHDRPFALDTGVALHDVTIAYETWGRLDATASNAILVCHAWTGDSHAAGPAGRGHTSGGWWDDLIGPGKPLDTDRWFIVCSNVLGGCQGSTGPASPHPRASPRMHRSRRPRPRPGGSRPAPRRRASRASHRGTSPASRRAAVGRPPPCRWRPAEAGCSPARSGPAR